MEPSSRPSVGQLVRVRSRQYLVEDVVPPPSPGEDTLVRLSCVEDDARGDALEVLWERELDGETLSGARALRVADRGFDAPSVFAAYLDTLQWSCVSATDPLLLQAPYRAGIEVMAYQLEPLRKALLLPRVNLFIADDVGLGKTIEAGLILRELLMRQKVRRVVVAAPPSVVLQWRDELEQRFGLTFVVFDREFVLETRRERGFSMNPFKTHSRFIVSHALLRDEAYASLLRDWISSDDHLRAEHREPALLILDEAHNAAPASGGARYAIDSKLTKTMRELAPLFEHRLFLSATPHNGHSNSFSALLEILDPQRFIRGIPPAKKHVADVMVRRLKEDLRGLGIAGLPRREVIQLDLPRPGEAPLPDTAPELALAALLDRYRELREAKVADAPKSQRHAARLVTISLQKRLLSSIEAFACTLAAHRRGLERRARPTEAAPRDADGRGARSPLEPPDADDPRADLPEAAVTAEEETTIELASAAQALSDEERALLDEMGEIAGRARALPDARVRALVKWLRQECLDGRRYTDRRVLVFTEYADTKRYLEERLREALADTDRVEQRIRTFHGGMDEESREEVKRAFNGPPAEHPLRILIATDAAREGVNLQGHCWDLFHFDVPWNPSRMEQRNGRLDRKLQTSPVVRCYYFVFTQRPEDHVLQTLVTKTQRIQAELGSLAPVLEARLARLLDGGIRRRDRYTLERAIREQAVEADRLAAAKEELDDAVRARREDLEEQLHGLRNLMETARDAIRFDEGRFRRALSAGLTLAGTSGLQPVDDHTWSLPDDPRITRDPTWRDTLDTLRAPRQRGEKPWEWRERAPIRPLVFRDVGALDDAQVHLHLEHRLVQRILGRFLAQGFVRDDLARAVALTSAGAIPRVVLLGRLSIFGEHGSRLHDRILAVAARWADPTVRKDALKPYVEGGRAEAETLREVERALADARLAPDGVRANMIAAADRDYAELAPSLTALADDEARAADALLSERGAREAASMRALIERQRELLQRKLDEERAPPPAQQQLDLALARERDEEERQRRLDRDHWRARLESLKRDLIDEPQRIREAYATRARWVEPVGLVYLWPVSG